MSPDIKKSKKLLYVSKEAQNIVDVFSVPKYSMVGKITHGIYTPEGLATDKNGNLYVSNTYGYTVTVYKPGATSPSLTLSEPYAPLDVAVGSNGYVYAADGAGGVDVYPPGDTSPSTRLTNSALSSAYGVGVDASNNVYVDGFGAGYTAVVVEYANGSGSGTNLGLTGLEWPNGVIIDNNNGPRRRPHIIVTDYDLSEILIYRPGQTTPSRTIAAPGAWHSAINKAENLIYVPKSNSSVGVYDYPSGTLVTTIPVGGSSPTTGAAVSPALAP